LVLGIIRINKKRKNNSINRYLGWWND